MTWTPDQIGGCEAAKVAPLVVRYLQGKCLDIGSGPGKVWPPLIGIDIQQDRGRPITDMTMDGTDLSTFRDGSFDGIFSSFLLHQIDPAKVSDVLKEWRRVIRDGGHLVLYLPLPDVPEEAELRAKWKPTLDEAVDKLRGMGGWCLVECEIRDQGNEYGMLIVARRTKGIWAEDLWQRNPDGKKRALVIRYGAIGDAIVAASVLPGLQKQGYHVTLNCRPSTQDVLRHDPHVDEWLVQSDDFVPNEMLGPYWSGMAERYDHVVNLSESVEGLLLALPGRVNHGYSDGARKRMYGKINYLEHTHDIADVPYEFAARFYPTAAELEKARWDYRKIGAPVIVWCVNGSSAHKVWPWVHVVAKWLLERTPAHIVLYGDPGVGRVLSEGIIDCLKQDGADTSRIRMIAGEWDIRRSLTFAHVVDCVIGPETGPMNAVGMAEVAKVIYLSHSAPNNLTKYWVNTTVLTPPLDKAPCYPCHRLHYEWTHCFKEEATGAALCASSISPERVFEAIALALGAVKVAA